MLFHSAQGNAQSAVSGESYTYQFPTNPEPLYASSDTHVKHHDALTPGPEEFWLHCDKQKSENKWLTSRKFAEPVDELTW